MLWEECLAMKTFGIVYAKDMTPRRINGRVSITKDSAFHS